MRTKLKHVILMAVLVMMFCLAGCGATLTTDMQIDDNFAGTRNMDVTISTSDYAENVTGDIMTLATLTDAAKPEGMTFTYEETADGYYAFHFAIPFSSKDDYTAKVSAILGEGYTPAVECNISNSAFATGVYFSENFSSDDLMDWFKTIVIDNGYADASDSSYIFQYQDDYVTVNGAQYESYYSQLEIDETDYVSIDNINIFTDLAEDGTIARKIELYINQNDKDANSASIESYLESVKPETAVASWSTSEDGYDAIYTLTIPACSADDMTTAMKTFTTSEDSYIKLISATDKATAKEDAENTEDTEETTSSDDTTEDYSYETVYPFGYVSTVDEYLDFSAYASNSYNEVDTYYYINTAAGKTRANVYFDNGDNSYGWDYVSDTYTDYNYVDSEYECRYNIVTDVTKYYVPASIDITTNVKSAKKMTREMVFYFDAPFEENEVDLIEANLATLYGDDVKINLKNKKKDASITMEFTGSVEEVNAAGKTVFGDSYSNIDFYKSDSFGLKQMYEYTENVDFGNFLNYEFSGKINYVGKMCGSIDKDKTYATGDVYSRREIKGKKLIATSDYGYIGAYVYGYKVHPVFIVMLCIFLAVVVAAAVVGVLFALKASKKNKAAANVPVAPQPGFVPQPPVMPVTPVTPVAPETPVIPVETPAAPAEPENTVEPEAPVAPETPAEPEAPVVPETPVAPAAPAPKFCRACGAPLVPGAVFCKECGTKIQ